MRRLLLATVIAAATLPLAVLSAAAAPMSTSDLLKPNGGVEQAYCKRHCHVWGWCGYRHHKYRCCKVWHRRCW